MADWGLSQNSSVTLQHALQSAANTSTAAAVLYIADFCYAGKSPCADICVKSLICHITRIWRMSKHEQCTSAWLTDAIVAYITLSD